MIAPGDGRPTCIGYASFLRQAELRRRLQPIAQGLASLDAGGRARLTEVQHLALQLVRALDPDRLQYPIELSEA
jgi:hypothetical protein